jgi:hypothetical protein
LATPNYGYEKRQRELAKKKKKEEKLKAKAAGRPHTDDGDAPAEGQDGGPQEPGATPAGNDSAAD